MRRRLQWTMRAGVVLAGVGMLTGCAGLTDAPGVSSAEHGQTRLRGGLHGGQQPVVGATIQLMAAGTGGYGGASTPLLTSAVVTDAQGGFTITGDYTCPTATTQVYLLATGGNPGLPAGQTNSYLSLMTGLGSCGNLNAQTFIAVNEVTTVATAYALAGYMTGAHHLSSSGTAQALQGLTVAMGTISRMVDTTTGTAFATTPAGNAIVPQGEINTIANILSACVNSAGLQANGGSNPCSTMKAATSAGGVPSSTIDVVVNMAHLPGQAVATLYNLQPPASPFQPTLVAAPSDWTLGLTYVTKLPGLTPTGGLAVDGSGNVWIAGSTLNAVRVIGSDGTEISGVAGYALPGVSSPTSVSIDLNGNGWVGGSNGTVAGVSSQGLSQSGTGYATGYPTVNGIAIGVDDTLWTTSRYNVAHLTTAGAPVAPTPAATYSTAFGAAVDSGGNLWFTNLGYQNVSKLFAGATYPSNYQVGSTTPRAVAIGRNDHAWIADAVDNGHAVSELDNTGAAVSGSPYTGGSLNGPWSIAVDGDNHAWVGLVNCRCLMAYATGGTLVSPSTGVAAATVRYGIGVGADGSGNLWVENNDGSIAELVGAAAPTVTPLVYAAANNLLGQRP